MHKEDFLKDVSWLYSLKTRLSYGVIGNQEIAPYSSLATVGAIGQGTFNNSESYLGQEPLRYPNPDLRSEEPPSSTSVWMPSLPTAVSQQPWMFTRNRPPTCYLYTPLPATSGFTGALYNIGGLRNRGFEAALTSHNTTGRVKWKPA
jgi:hypothetical protein